MEMQTNKVKILTLKKTSWFGKGQRLEVWISDCSEYVIFTLRKLKQRKTCTRLKKLQLI